MPTPWQRCSAVVCLAAFTAVLLVQRLHTYNEALERDIAGYAVIAREMLHGRHLYSDLWERKPPLLYATFAAAQLFCGFGIGEIFFLNITAATATLIALYFAGKHIGNGKVAGLVTAFLWVLIGGDMGTQANQPNAEVFVNACLCGSFALLTNWTAKARFRRALLLGLLLASATLYKQHVVLTAAALLSAHLLRPRPQNPADRKPLLINRLQESSLAAAVIAAVWLSIAGYFLAVHRFEFFFDTLFRQNISYSGDIRQNLFGALLPRNSFPDFAPWTRVFPPLLLAAILIERRWIKKPFHPNLFLWLAWAAGTAITFALPGKFFGHYYQLWIPVWCVAGGWATVTLLRETRPGYRVLNRGLVAAAIGCLLGLQGTQYLSPADEWTHRKYPVDDFLQERKMGLQLQVLLPPGHSFYNLGEDTPLYFYSNRSPASGLLYLGPLETGDERSQYRQRLLNDLIQSNPDLIVTSALRNTTLRKDALLLDWLGRHYTPVAANLGCPIYRLLVRTGTPLASQLTRSEKTIAELDPR
jgi:4-amino-4-deoxy-L-arabinose transferase-like glycosyltransferase